MKSETWKAKRFAFHGDRAAPALIALFFAVFVGVPLLTLAGAALTGKPPALFDYISRGKFRAAAGELANPSLDSIRDLGTTRRYRRAAWHTIVLASTVATLASLLAFPLSWALGAMRRFGRVGAVFLLPLAMHPYLYAFAIILIFRQQGLFARLFGGSPVDPFSVTGLILTQTAAYFPLALLVQTPCFASYRSGWGLVAGVMGAGPALSFVRVWLPMNMAGICGGWILVALRSMSDLMSPMLLVSTRFRLVVLEAWRDLAGSNWWPGAAALSLELLAFTIVLLVLERRLVGPSAPKVFLGEPEVESSKKFKLLGRLLSLYGAVLMLLPLAGVMVIACFSFGGLRPMDWTFHYYRETAGDLAGGLWVSLILGFVVAAVSLVASLVVSRSLGANKEGAAGRFIIFAAGLAFVVPSTVYAISLIGVFNRPPLLLHFTPALLILALIATRMSYALSIVGARARALGPDWEFRASGLGASAIFRFRWATWPQLRPAFMAGATLIFVSSVQDIALAILIAPPRFYPLSLIIGRNIGDGLFSQASALAMSLVVLLSIPLVLTAGNLTSQDYRGLGR
ncbi:MAG: hypothetical protein AAB091_05885 [Elusimicrobiota bacterium]